MNVMTSPICPTIPRFIKVFDTLAANDFTDCAWSEVITANGWFSLTACAPLVQFSGGVPVLYDQSFWLKRELDPARNVEDPIRTL